MEQAILVRLAQVNKLVKSVKREIDTVVGSRGHLLGACFAFLTMLPKTVAESTMVPRWEP